MNQRSHNFRNPFTRSPLLRILLPFVLGILFSEWVVLPFSHLAILLCLTVALMAFSFCFTTLSTVSQWLFRLPLCLFALTFGLFSAQLHDPAARSDFYGQFLSSGRSVEMVVRLNQTPQPTAKSMRVSADVLQMTTDAVSRSVSGEILLFFPPATEGLTYGSIVHIRTHPRLPSANLGGPDHFNYRRYLRHKGILFQAYISDYALDPLRGGEKSASKILTWSHRLQSRLVGRLHQSGLTPAHQGIAAALLLGWKSDLDPQTIEDYRDAGVMHLLCVSGLHVGLLAGIVGYVLKLIVFIGRVLVGKLHSSKRNRIGSGSFESIAIPLVQLLSIWLFALLTALSPATVRASIMFSVMIVGQSMTRRSSMAASLSFAALLLLLFNPGLLFDVGFQLSFSAMYGILFLYQPLHRLLYIPEVYLLHGHRLIPALLQRLLRVVWSWTALSTAAQLGTLPLSLFYFHQIPIYFLVANLTIVPCAGLLLFAALLLLVLGFSSLLSDCVARVLTFLLNIADHITHWVATLPGSVVTDLHWDVSMVIATYIVLFSGACLLRRIPHSITINPAKIPQ